MQRVCMASLHATLLLLSLFHGPHTQFHPKFGSQGVRAKNGNGLPPKWEIILLFSSERHFVISCLCMIILCCPASRNSAPWQILTGDKYTFPPHMRQAESRGEGKMAISHLRPVHTAAVAAPILS